MNEHLLNAERWLTRVAASIEGMALAGVALALAWWVQR